MIIGDDDDEEEGGEEGEGEAEEKMPTCGDYIMHFLTLFWKIIFAFIPPAGKLLFKLRNGGNFSVLATKAADIGKISNHSW